MKVYMFAGLGADSRMYNPLKSHSKNEIIALDWLPVNGSKTIGEYAKQFVGLIDTSSPFAIGGVSLGGLIAIELHQILKCGDLVLISTPKDRSEKPLFFKFLQSAPMHRLFKKKGLLWAAGIGDKFTIKSKEGRKLFYQMLEDSKEEFLIFGANAAINWDNSQKPKKFFHIHGTSDRIFPFSNISDAIPVKKGNHFMIFDRAEEIAKEMDKYLI